MNTMHEIFPIVIKSFNKQETIIQLITYTPKSKYASKFMVSICEEMLVSIQIAIIILTLFYYDKILLEIPFLYMMCL